MPSIPTIDFDAAMAGKADRKRSSNFALAARRGGPPGKTGKTDPLRAHRAAEVPVWDQAIATARVVPATGRETQRPDASSCLHIRAMGEESVPYLRARPASRHRLEARRAHHRHCATTAAATAGLSCSPAPPRRVTPTPSPHAGRPRRRPATSTRANRRLIYAWTAPSTSSSTRTPSPTPRSSPNAIQTIRTRQAHRHRHLRRRSRPLASSCSIRRHHLSACPERGWYPDGSDQGRTTAHHRRARGQTPQDGDRGQGTPAGGGGEGTALASTAD